MAIQMNVSGLRRNLKNIAHNYTDAQVKVREATSNDPWGPSSTLMSEIADLTYNVVAFSEIMQMVWKRLNDHGRNWRHVYKALVLLEYLIKTGSEKVADQCKENIYTIQTLKDFQYLEENKDMGINVREKAKSLVALLKDDERLRNERVRALKAKERFAQTVSGIGSDSDFNSPTSPSYPDAYVTSGSRSDRDSYGGTAEHTSSNSDLESARPQTVGEEELQLQLALAMSKEEADQEEAKKKSDDVRLQMALSQSETDYQSNSPPSFASRQGHSCSTLSPSGASTSFGMPREALSERQAEPVGSSRTGIPLPYYKEKQQRLDKDRSALNDLLDINFNPSGMAASSSMSALPSQPPSSSIDPWGIPVASAASSGSLSPQNASHRPPPKTSLLDVFQDYDEMNETQNSINSIEAMTDPWGVPLPSRDVSTPKNDPWNSPASAPSSRVTSPTDNDPWTPAPPKSPEVPAAADPWAPVASVQMKAGNDPWCAPPTSTTRHATVDPFAPIASNNEDEFSAISHRNTATNEDNSMPSENGYPQPVRPDSKSPTTFLGENSNLVNLENLVSLRSAPAGMGGISSPSYQNMNSLSSTYSLGMNFSTALGNSSTSTTTASYISSSDSNKVSSHYNPFISISNESAEASSFVSGVNPFNGPSQPNPFQAQQAPKPSMNQMRTMGGSGANSPWDRAASRDENPFIL